MVAVPGGSAETAGRPPSDADRTPPTGGVTTVYVGLVTRAIAIVIDTLLIDVVALAVTGAVLLIFSVFSVTNKHNAVGVVIGGAAFVVWVIGYFVAFWTTTGQTPGNRVMHIRVLRTDGSRLRPRHALIRLGAMVISLPLFWGYLPILTSARRRGVPDGLAGTVVILANGPGQSKPQASSGGLIETVAGPPSAQPD
jgi:uncharacterized RDD family membrane protein YckC